MPLDDDYKIGLTYYVKDALENGISRDEIKTELRNQGCDETELKFVLRVGDDMFLDELSKPRKSPRISKKLKLLSVSIALVFLLILGANKYYISIPILVIGWMLVRRQQRD